MGFKAFSFKIFKFLRNRNIMFGLLSVILIAEIILEGSVVKTAPGPGGGVRGKWSLAGETWDIFKKKYVSCKIYFVWKLVFFPGLICFQREGKEGVILGGSRFCSFFFFISSLVSQGRRVGGGEGGRYLVSSALTVEKGGHDFYNISR